MNNETQQALETLKETFNDKISVWLDDLRIIKNIIQTLEENNFRGEAETLRNQLLFLIPEIFPNTNDLFSSIRDSVSATTTPSETKTDDILELFENSNKEVTHGLLTLLEILTGEPIEVLKEEINTE